jgi:hypothetical protein
MSAQYYRITRRLGTPHRNSVTVTIPLVGPQGPAGPAGPKGDPGEVSGSIAWDNVTEKPTTFPPESHTHQASEIVDFTEAVEAVSPPADWDTLANKPSTFPPSSHGHVAADVSDFSTAAAAAAPVQSVAGKTGTVTLAKADVGLSNVDNTADLAKPISTATQSALDGKAATSHTHTATQVTDFNAAAAAAAPVASVAGRTGAITLAVADVSGAVADTDARLSDSRTPTSHASSHFSAGADPIAPSDIGAADASHTHSLYTEIQDAILDDPQTAFTDIASNLAPTPFDAGGSVVGFDSSFNDASYPLSDFAASGDIPDPSSSTPQPLGSASAGTSDDYSRGDHVHAAPALNDLSNVSAATPSDNDVLVFDTATSTWLAEAPAGGGIGGGTGSTDNAILRADGTGGSTLQDSALVIDDATTSTQANIAIVNAHSETNSALVLTPKGDGAFIVGPKPDGTSTGGNARGANAIDIQNTRNNNLRVASGLRSICIGNDCRAAPTDSIVIGTNNNCAGGGIIIGVGNTNSDNTSIMLGSNNGAGGANTVIIGNGANSAGVRAGFSTLPFRAAYWGGQTTNDTATVLNLDATATNRFNIAANTALAVDILLIARRSDTADKWLVARRFLGIRRDGSNNTSLIGAVQTLGTDQSDGSPSWSFTLTADDTNEALQLEVTGAASETVQWRATAFYRVV